MVLVHVVELYPREVLADAPVERDVVVLGAHEVLGLRPVVARVASAAHDGQRQRDEQRPLQPPPTPARLDEVLVHERAERALRRSADLVLTAAGWPEGTAGRGRLPARPAELGGPRRGGLQRARVAELVLVLRDGADDDRGVVELAGHRVVAVHVQDVGDDAGDVVGSATAQGELDQLLHGLVRPVVAGERLFQRLVADHPGQSVRADQIPVAGPHLADRQIGLDMIAAAQRPHQQRPLRMRGGFLFGDPALVDQPLHPGVVLGDLGQHAVAQQIRPRVTDVDEAEPLSGPQQGGQGRAHALQLGVLLDHHPQLVIGARDGRAQRGEEVGAGDVVVELDERGDHLGGGDLTGGLAAHAVGDGEQPWPGIAGVLVALADHALVRSGGEAQ